MANKKWTKGLKQVVIMGMLLLSLMYMGCTEVVEEPSITTAEEINETNTKLVEEIIEVFVEEQLNETELNETIAPSPEWEPPIFKDKNLPSYNIEYDAPWE